MTLDELKSYLRSSGISFAVEVEDIPPSNLWTAAEQIQDCCEEQSGFDECIDAGKTEPWSGWTDEQRNELGVDPPSPSPEELLARAEDVYGKGNVHLQVSDVGPVGNCGEMETTWTGELGCCEDPDELLKLSGTVLVIVGNNYEYKVNQSSGELPVSWSALGVGINITSDGTTGRAEITECFCTPGVIVATDGCNSVAPWIIYRADGTWTSVDDEELSSPWGWFQDGVSANFYLQGFNNDYTKVSTQYYWEEAFSGTWAAICAASYLSINEDPLVTPGGDLQGFSQCSGRSVWARLRSTGPDNVWDVRYPLDSQSTVEYTNSCTEDVMTYDDTNSVAILADNSNGTIYWEDGIPPFTLSIEDFESNDLWFDTSHTQSETSTSNRHATVYSGNICGYSQITITDSCGSSVVGELQAADGQWQRDYNSGAGALGDATNPPYEFDYPAGSGSGEGCPATFENSGFVTVAKNGQTARYKITQQYYQKGTCTYAGSGNETYAESVAHCNGVSCSDVALHPYRYIGGCFYLWEFCHICGYCGWATGLATNDCPGCSVAAADVTFDLGKNYSHRYHGEYTEPTYGYYFTYVYCISTTIDIWVC